MDFLDSLVEIDSAAVELLAEILDYTYSESLKLLTRELENSKFSTSINNLNEGGNDGNC